MQADKLFSALQKLTNKEVTQADICKILNCSSQKMSARVSRNSTFKDSEIAAIETALGISLTQQNVDNALLISPIEASCGNGLTVDTSLINNYDSGAKYSFAVAKGNSMQPTISDNDICVIQNFNGDFADGIYLFSIDNEMFIKRLSNNINQLVCLSDNPDFDKIILKGDELDKVNIVGRVVTIIKKV